MIESFVRVANAGARRDPQRLLTEAEFPPTLDGVIRRTYEIAGSNPVDFDAMENLPNLRDDETKATACWTTIYLYRAILELPPGEAAALTRTLMASDQ